MLITSCLFILRRQGPSSAGDGLNNSGYVDAGSASNYANPSGLPPMKPGSKKENKQEKKGKKEVKQKETNQQQALPLYAQVDKSKKTPKAPVNTYDQVERSRKVRVKLMLPFVGCLGGNA